MQIGEQLYRSGNGKALRYMHNPSLDGSVSAAGDAAPPGPFPSPCCTVPLPLPHGLCRPHPSPTQSPNCYNSKLGSLNVHYSSGVANHFFYLLAEGSNPKTGSNLPVSPTCNGLPVDGIGRDAAAKIVYRALATYMVSSTNYAGACAAA